MIRKVGIHVLSKNVWVTSNMLRDFRKIWEFRLCIPNHGADLIRADLVLLGIKIYLEHKHSIKCCSCCSAFSIFQLY